jgi:photosystem II stability/assembly factor-like uncharacterized protein
MRRVRRHLLLSVAAWMLGAWSQVSATVQPAMLLLDGVVVGPAIVAVGERGTILRSGDSGRTWLATPSSTHATLTGVSFAPDGRHGWAVGHDALILHTTDGGLTWARQWQGESLAESFLDVLALDAQHVIAVGAFGLCVITTDGGATWTPRRLLDEDYHLNRLTRGPDGTLYLAGEHGTLLRSMDAGDTWDGIHSPYDGSFYGILPLDATTLLAYGLRGRIYRSTDKGDDWSVVPNPRRVLLQTAVRMPDGLILLAGQNRALFISRDEGLTVADWPAALQTAVAELLITPDGGLLALGEAGATLLTLPDPS